MSFRRRTYPEVLDNLLTTLTGGVAAEPYPFPPPNIKAPPYNYPLQQPPVADIIAVYGSQNGQSHQFRKEKDFRLKDGRTLEWIKDGEFPDAGTLFYINYTPASARTTMTDIHTGSVVRTLAETTALEIARLYAVLEMVYQSAYIDTANGTALDNVVALLGISRVTGGHAAGMLEFTRTPGSHGAITILAGTRVITPDGEVEYTTTETVTMANDQNAIRVNARDTELNDPLLIDSLTVLPLPILGVASVTNPTPTLLSAQEETDNELRERAKSFLHGSERATLGALKQAIDQQGVAVTVEEKFEDGCLLEDGRVQVIPCVQVTPHVDLSNEQRQRLLTAIEAVRPMGVKVCLSKTGKPPAEVILSLRLVSSPDLLEQDLRAAQSRVREKVTNYINRLPVDQEASQNRIVGLVLSEAEFKDVTVVNFTADGDSSIKGPVTIKELQLVDPNLPTYLSITVTSSEGSVLADEAEIRAAVSTYINDLNSTNATSAAGQNLSYDLLLSIIPLPENAGKYNVTFVFSQQNNLSWVLKGNGDVYSLEAMERLVLQNVVVAEE